MDCLNRKRVVKNTCLGIVAAMLAAGAISANAQADKREALTATEKSAMEQYRDMSDNERAAIVNEATEKSAIATRSATPAERAMMSQSPASARAQLNSSAASSGLEKRTGNGVGKDLHAGNSSGKVLGTAFFNSRTITHTKDGVHLETCESGAHAHDVKTTAAKAADNKGAPRE